MLFCIFVQSQPPKCLEHVYLAILVCSEQSSPWSVTIDKAVCICRRKRYCLCFTAPAFFDCAMAVTQKRGKHMKFLEVMVRIWYNPPLNRNDFVYFWIHFLRFGIVCIYFQLATETIYLAILAYICLLLLHNRFSPIWLSLGALNASILSSK